MEISTFSEGENELLRDARENFDTHYQNGYENLRDPFIVDADANNAEQIIFGENTVTFRGKYSNEYEKTSKQSQIPFERRMDYMAISTRRITQDGQNNKQLQSSQDEQPIAISKTQYGKLVISRNDSKKPIDYNFNVNETHTLSEDEIKQIFRQNVPHLAHKKIEVIYASEDNSVQNEEVSNQIKPKVKPIFKPRINNSASSFLESIVEDIDRPPGAVAMGRNASAGTYKGRISAGAYARASTGDAEARFSVFHARASGPLVGTGAHVSLVGAGAYANAEIARAEASAAGVTVGVGLNVNTGVVVGLDGVSVSVLGFGGTVRPHNVSLRAPFLDVSCCIV